MTDAPPAVEAPEPDRSLWVIGGGIALLVVVAVIAVVLLVHRILWGRRKEKPV